MNEEQKEENFPAPALPENNQNIATAKKWQIKSWQIVLVGFIIQIVIALYLHINIINEKYGYLYGFEGQSTVLSEIDNLNLVTLFIPLLVFILSITKKIRIVGIFAGIIFGIIELIFASKFLEYNNNIPEALFIIPGLVFLFAGIYYFWKKV